MDNKLFTALEIIVIGGLIAFVLYLGGVFTPAPTATAKPTTPLAPTLDLTQAPTRTPPPTQTPTPVMPTPTPPPLTQPTGLIAFNSTRTGDTEVFVVNAADPQLRNLTNNPAEDYVLDWSPDGSRLAFFSTRSQWLELYVIEIETNTVTQLTDTRASNTAYSYPISWSPDGQFILSARSTPWLTGGYTRSAQLDLIRADGGGTTLNYHIDNQYPFRDARLSPDGLYVALTLQSDEEGYGVYVAELTANGLKPPYLVGQSCYGFAWVPNSHRLTCGDGFTLVTLDPQEGDQQSIDSTGEDYISNFSWSPDGQWLLALYEFYSRASDPSEQTFVALSATDQRQFQVVSDTALEAETSAAWNWSGDSQWIAYTSSRFGSRDIFITNIFDSSSTRQISPGGENFSPRWQPGPPTP